MPKCIVVINDNEDILRLFNEVLEQEAGYKVVMLSTYDNQMMDHVKEAKPDLIISDHIFGGEKHGWDIVQILRLDRETSEVPIIVCTAAVNDLREMQDILEGKEVDLLFKPFDVDELLELVNSKLGGPAKVRNTM